MSALNKTRFMKNFAAAAALTTALTGCVTLGGNAAPYAQGGTARYSASYDDPGYVTGNGPACRAFQQAQRRNSYYSGRDSSRGLGQIVGGVADIVLSGGSRSADRRISRGIETTTRGTIQGMANQRQIAELRAACEAETRNGYCETRTYDSSVARTVNGRVTGSYEGAVRQNRNCTKSGTARQQMPPLNGVVRP